ncbi:amino acid adenylation domain-containing protein [Micromonospora kangleipakensis]|uniref:Amino acid adenylation domain-containing protein n=1 Tax=Micromonospora kangleipakensis TaxID=1077942 RepID=A0A4Q8BFC4_9ACTN|nr:non-ribosomal peptide synthetase [Micromonospora kangleipakensis]RZU76664.1 amino acid adenylation domain-containing protein [Micromonospora kangleipakensis]
MTGHEALTDTRGGQDAGGRAGADRAAPYAVGPDRDYPEATLVDLILAAAARRGPAVAVRQWHEVLSYTELVDRAGALAATLRGHGVGPETRVGICAERRPDLLVAVLGVLLAGGCYVPLDRAHPQRRFREIARDAGLSTVVIDKAGREALSDPDLRLVNIPTEPVGPPPAAVACPARPDNAAYVLYTSGSTGRPKGVVVSHRSVVAHVTAFGAYSGADETCRAFGFAPLGFDASVQDLFIPLVAGGEIALVPDADRVDPVRLQRFAEAHRVTWGCLPAALLPLLDPDRLPHWRTVFTGIESPAPEQVERWTGPADRPTRWFSNGYGPTEATVCVTGYLASGSWDGPVPMGRPLANHRIHLVDADGDLVPPGTPGEVLIGGVGLARGYLGRPALTAERFVPDPFSGEPGARLYRTGDRAVWLPDRQLLFLGRIDRQVKVRGQRVELGEVEAVLGEHPQVRQAAVVPADGPAGTELVAVVAPALSPPDGELLEFLRQRVPDVMVPRRLLRLDELPLTPSGKRDAARLAELAAAGFAALTGSSDEKSAGAAGAGLDATPASGLAGSAGASGTPDERAVAGAWRRVLGARTADRDDDFFAAGGTSLSAMRMVALLRDELRRDVSVADILEGRTLGGLAARVADADRLTEPELIPGQPPTLSPSQRRLWFLDQLAPDSAAYNTAMAERLRGRLELTALRAALRAVADRHEVLRWRITRVAGAPHVICDPPGDVPLTVVDVSGMGRVDREAALRARLQASAATRFDLATGPVWKAELYRLDAHEHVLAMTFHHAVFDGWSQAVLYDQFATAYRAARDGTAPLDPLPATYADYAVWRAARDRLRGPDDLAWWTAHLAGAPTVLELPADRVRPAAQTYRGEFASAPFTPELDARVRGLATRLGATPSTVLLAAFGEVLRRLVDRTDHVVGVVVADRRLAAVADLVGFFVDIAPVRLHTDGGSSFTDQVLACRQELLDVLAHPNAPLERIVQELSVPRDPARPPLVQVLFNVFNFAEPALDLPDLVAERVPAGLPGSPFDLTLYLVERNGVLALDAVYNPDLFAAARIADLLDGYLAVLDSLTDAPERPADSAPAPALSRVRAGAVRSTPPPTPAGRAPVGPAAGADPVAPSGPNEELVARVWRETLRVDRVGATDSFFDLGGHSIAMAEVQHRLAEAIGREIALVDLFRYPNVRALAAFLDGAENSDGIHLALQRAADRRARARGRQQRRPTGTPGRADP